MKAELSYTLSRKYSIAKLRPFDNGTNTISINFMDYFGYLKSKKGAIILSIFCEVKELLTARQAAEYYGLKVRRNGTACCPFHDDKHPSMKIDKNYHCFACGVGGDAVDYVSRMFGLSQYDAALKLIEDFRLPISVIGKAMLNKQEMARIRKEKAEKERIIHIKERFKRWCVQSIDILRDCLQEIEAVKNFLRDKPPDTVFSDDYAQMLHAAPIMNYWLDILCMGETAQKQELFIKNRKEVVKLVQRVRNSGRRIMENHRGRVGCRDEHCGRCAL